MFQTKSLQPISAIFILVKYKITTKTGNSQEASTDSNVFLEIFGANAKTGKLSLNNSVSLDKNENLFEKGKTNIFEVESVNVGKV